MESVDKLPDRDKCRRKPVLSKLKMKAKEYNKKLVAANQPPLVDEELIAANSYTGPVRVPRCVWPPHILQVTPPCSPRLVA